MEAFSGIINNLGGAGGIMKGLGAITSIAGMINQYSLANKEKAALDRSIYYSKHPEAINSLVKQFDRPLETGLVKGTENIVNASLAEQGLSQAPGIQSQVLAQALAPYQQNEQQMAITEAFKALGLPAETLTAIQSTMRPDQLAQMLKGILPGQQQSPGSIPYPYPSIPTPPDSGGITATPPFDPTQPLPGTGPSMPNIFGIPEMPSFGSS
jgi:hypothetical protein